MGRVFVNLLVLCGVAGRPSPLLKAHRDVVTTQGAVRGYMGGEPPHFAYFGMPYGRPPTRHDRFKAPKPPPSWDGIFEATHKIKCPQPDGNGEENCLVVNVFAPKHATALSVIVIVHGGSFQKGWGPHQPPSRLLQEGFIVVTFNYRFAALGFLCLGSPDAPGNAGLKDQIAALYWINRNIARFGGNPDDVIVYGTGSGATSVQFLLLSGLAKGLLHKVILESGSALAPNSLGYDPVSMAFAGANAIGYEGTDDLEELLQFYRNTPARDLIGIPNMFLPCIESHNTHGLLDGDPIHILKQGNYHKVPMLIVYADTEGRVIMGNKTEIFEKVPENFEQLLPNNLEFDNRDMRRKVANIVKEFYFGDGFVKELTLNNYAHYINDVFSEYPIVKFAMLYASNNSHFVYVMKTSLEETTEEKFSTMMDYFYSTYDENDKLLLEKLTTLWMNFIKISDPTPLTTTLIPIIWQPVTTNQVDNADISMTPILMFPSLKMSPLQSQHRLLFLDNIYNRFYKPHVLENSKTEDFDDKYF